MQNFFFFLIKDLAFSYLKVSSLQSVLASPAERGFTSESCRSFPLRSSSFRCDVSELRTEARSAQHFWRMHSFNLQARICFIPIIHYNICYSILKNKTKFKVTWILQELNWSDIKKNRQIKKKSHGLLTDNHKLIQRHNIFVLSTELAWSDRSISSLQFGLLNPAHSSWMSGPCRLFPLRSSSSRLAESELRAEPMGSKHFCVRPHQLSLTDGRMHNMWRSDHKH